MMKSQAPNPKSQAPTSPANRRTAPVFRLGFGIWVVGLGTCLAFACVASETIARAQSANAVETDPIRCWWKTDRSAIRAGERFDLTLTCGVIETPAVKVVPTLTQLDPGALQIPPFEVVGGVRRADLVSAPRRYFQYDYTARLIAEGFFGQDVNIPALSITYHVQSAAGEGSEGRDRTYVLPALPIRVLSLVPKEASDIRDSETGSFADIDARRFRANAAFTAAGVLFAFSVVLVLVAAVHAFGRARQRRPAAARVLPAGVVLGACVRALKAVKADVVRGGWTPERARRALAALRLAAAISLDRRVAQEPVTGPVNEREGQILVRHGWLRRRRTLVSASTTPAIVMRAIDAAPVSARGRDALEQLGSALATFSSVAYGRDAELDRTQLDAALEIGIAAAQRQRVRRLWRPSILVRKEQWASS